METEITLDNLTDKQQTRMCELCEELILEGSSNSSHFQCEGGMCSEAIQYIIDDEEEKRQDSIKTKPRYQVKLKKQKHAKRD
jgi:hypothetical protein